MTRGKANFIQIKQAHPLPPHPPAVPSPLNPLPPAGIYPHLAFRLATAWLRFRRDTLQIKSLLRRASATLD